MEDFSRWKFAMGSAPQCRGKFHGDLHVFVLAVHQFKSRFSWEPIKLLIFFY